MELSGADTDNAEINSAVVKVYSGVTDPGGILLPLVESGSSSGVYRSYAQLAGASSQQTRTIGAATGEVVTAYSLRGGASDTITVHMDTTPPSAVPAVNDGFGLDIDETTDSSVLKANWPAATDEESGIAGYWYSIGTAPGQTDVAGWTDNGGTKFVSCSGLSLTVGKMYYFNVKAENNAGLFSAVASSDGQRVIYSTIPLNPSVAGPAWNLVGVSRSGASLEPGSVFSTGAYDIYSYDGSVYTGITGESSISLEYTGGYWIYSQESVGDITVYGSQNDAATATVSLTPRWNLFSLPYEGEVEWSDAAGPSFTCGGSPAGLPAIYGYNSGYERISPGSGTLVYPWKAYWVSVDDNCELVFTKP